MTPSPTSFVPDLLKGQVAIITGGGSGIGLGIAYAFARHGAKLMIAGRKVDKLTAAATELRALGAEVDIFPLDVRQSREVEKMFDPCRERFGRHDLLVNNAAGNFFSPAIAMSDNAFAAVVNIDLFGTFYCARAAGRRWLERDESGRIINISMTLHYRGMPGMVHASAAKAGI